MATTFEEKSRIGKVRENLSMVFPSNRDRYKAQVRTDFLKSVATGDITKNLGNQLLYQGYGYTDMYAYHPKDIYVPREKLSFRRRDQIYKDCAILRVVIDKVTKEINRKGLRVSKSFVRKCRRVAIDPCMSPVHRLRQKRGQSPIDKSCTICPNPSLPLGQEGCEEEYQTNQKRCIECGFPTRDPDLQQKRMIRRLLKEYINEADQTLIQVMTHIAMDVEIHDNAFLINEFTYVYEDPEVDTKPSYKIWKQTYRGNPQRIRPVISINGVLGGNLFTCIKHRETHVDIPKENRPYAMYCEVNMNPDTNSNPIICGEPLQQVTYAQIRDEGANMEVQWNYIEGEVQHIKKYFPAGAMGVSLIDSLYYVVLQVIGMEKWVAEYYLKMRMFKGFITTPNNLAGEAASVQDMFATEFSKWRRDPYYIPIFAIPADATTTIQHNRIDDSPQELQFTQQRQEARQQIANAYGVSNVWMNDTSTGAGLNNEGIDMAITNRHIAWGQTILVEQALKPMCASILNVDKLGALEYFIDYNIHEEQDLMAEKQRRATDLANASMAQQIGAHVFINSDNEFVFAAPKEGMPLEPMAATMNRRNYQNVQGMSEQGLPYERRAQSKAIEGAPNEPRIQGSGLTVKSLEKEGGAHAEGTYTTSTPGLYQPRYGPKDDEEKSIESVAECVERKVPVIQAENPDMERKQVIAIAYDMCRKNHIHKAGNDPCWEGYEQIGMKEGKDGKMVPDCVPISKAERGSDPKTPAKPSERRSGSKKNPKGSASSTSGKITFDEKTLASIKTNVKEHNDKVKEKKKESWRKITMAQAKAVVRRGMGAFSTSHRPGMNRVQWGLGRLNAFSTLMLTDKPKNAKYTTDNDLLPSQHPRHSSEKKKIKKASNLDFESKHERDERGRFKPKPKPAKQPKPKKVEQPTATQNFATQGQDGTGGPTVGNKIPPVQSTIPKPKPVPVKETLLEHAKKFDGFIIDADKSYYPGSGYWVGTPLNTAALNLNNIDSGVLDARVDQQIDTIQQLPQDLDYVVYGWTDNGFVYVSIAEVYKDEQLAKKEANKNGEVEYWDFDENIAKKVEGFKKGEEIIYDFFKRRYNYWKNMKPLEISDYIAMKG